MRTLTRRIPAHFIVGIVLCAIAIGIAGGVAWQTRLTAVLALGGMTTGVMLLWKDQLSDLWLICLAVLLAGYAMLGRGFAYLGVPPLFVGELVLGFGVLVLVLSGGLSSVRRSRLIWLWLILAAIGAHATIPYLEHSGIQALRDAVVWGYGIFAILTAAFLLCSGRVAQVVELYARFVPFFIFWMPIGLLIHRLQVGIPRLPLSGHPILHLKSGDAAVHLAGAATFILLGLHHSGRERPAPYWSWETPGWVFWFAAVCLTAATNRGGMLALLCAIGLVTLVRPSTHAIRAALIAVVVGALALSLNISLDFGGSRVVSFGQIVSNLQSIVDSEAATNREDTRQWRLDWWNTIIDYTFYGDYFWTGKGYGINLADDDGFQVMADGSLRSPHNGHLTILARSGVPGLLAWLALQLSFGVSIARFYLRAHRGGNERWAHISLWLLAYWVAFLIDSSFDVALEGPQLGIWFWSLVGFGIAILQQQGALCES